MSFSNLEYLYNHLPARYRREDADGFLKRYLTWFGETLDRFDGAYDDFSASIDPDTASEAWIKFWMLVLFGWGWYPWWFEIADLRRLYANFAGHLARRGTRTGIERFLRDFGVIARVHTRILPLGELVLGETSFFVTTPLVFVVEILALESDRFDNYFLGEAPLGEAFVSVPRPLFSDADIFRLLQFCQPQAQEIKVVWSAGRRRQKRLPGEQTYWEQLAF